MRSPTRPPPCDPHLAVILSSMSSDCEPQQGPTPVSSDGTPRVKILLHATDGAFPYLTPYLLDRCCLASPNVPMLQLAIAVQDSCITPTFVRKDGTVGKKPSGFQVTAFAMDEWLHDYPRVAVPTWDPRSILPGLSARNHRAAAPPRPTTITTATTTKKTPKPPSINLQTLNGRVQVTHDDYRQMAASSSSSFAAILPLFEHPPDDSRPPKHVMERNFEWTVAALVGHDPSRNGDGGGSPTTAVWLPVSVCGIVAAAATTSSATAPPPRTRGIVGDHGRDDDDHHHPTYDLHELVDDVCRWMANLDEPLRRRLSHVCLVDWHLVPEETTRRQLNILNAFDEKLPASLGLALLAVDTVEQLSLAMQFAQTTSRLVTIGTSLPTKLAQQCRALTVQRPRNAEGPTEQKKIKLDPITATVANAFDKSDAAATAFSSTVTVLKATDPVSAHPWFQDAGPIDDDCSCRTCQDHSRSYLYHLACSNELLVEILLFVHNLHQILHGIRSSQEEAT
jgi:Queuine tRNA-ribosyltransferase